MIKLLLPLRTPPPRRKRKVVNCFLQILHIRYLLVLRVNIRHHLKCQLLLHSPIRLNPLPLLFCVLTLQTLPTVLYKTLVVVEMIARQAEVRLAHLDAIAALRAAEDAIAGCRIIFGLVLQPEWVDEAALAVAFLAAVLAAVNDLSDDASAITLFALEGLQFVLEADYFASRWLALIILGIAFEQIHALLPFALQLEIGDVDCLLKHALALTALAGQLAFRALALRKSQHARTNSLNELRAKMEGMTVRAGYLASLPSGVIPHTVLAMVRHIS